MKKILITISAVLISIVILFVICHQFIFHYITEWLWFSSVGYTGIFYRLIFIKSIYFLLPFLIFLFMFFIWFYVIRRIRLNLILSIIFLLIAAGYGFWGLSGWKYLIYKPLHIESGYSDPFFHLNAFFYMFELPLIRQILLMIFTFFILVLALNLILHKEGGKAQIRGGKIFLASSSIISYVLALISGLLYYASLILEKLIVQPNPRLGVDYVVFFGNFYGNFIWIGLVIIFSIIALLRKNSGLSILNLVVFPGLLILFYFGLTGLYPYLLDNLYVKPNEIMVQRSFIKDRIEATRYGFGISFSPLYYPEYNNLKKQIGDIFSTLRIWDSDPYKRVINQVQSIKTYFTFNDVDIDAYSAESGSDEKGREKLSQVVLSARELNIGAIPADSLNWDNIHLRYTHGFGVVISPSFLADNEGNPVFWFENLDQKPIYNDFNVMENRIYFGELTSNYIIINTKADEFDYTASTNRITTRYDLKRGVKLDGFFKKLFYSAEFNEKNILLSSYITKDSAIIYHRQILDRVKKIFPFLEYDNDPYITIINGGLYWIIDAYTVSDRFPISEKFKSGFGFLNYIRNSVKVVINAYSGDTDYYLTDPDDPVALAYKSLFPGFFKNNAPEGTKKHYRYPYNLLKIQADVLCKYHVENEDSFYSGDDIWEIPKQIYGDKPENFEPYYQIAVFETNNTGDISNSEPIFQLFSHLFQGVRKILPVGPWHIMIKASNCPCI